MFFKKFKIANFFIVLFFFNFFSFILIFFKFLKNFNDILIYALIIILEISYNA